jgi:hypothetical protein
VNFKLISALAAGLLLTGPTFAATVTVDFDGLNDLDFIGDAYNGGASTPANSGSTTPHSGPNYGISFGPSVISAANSVDFTYYSNAPTPGAVMAAVDADGAMNVASGFTGQLSFYYSTTADTSVNVYSGLNGTGDLLGTINLLANATAANGCTEIAYCFWSVATFDFAGLAKSIQFGSTAGLAAFDDVTVNAVPLPAAGWLLLSALGGFGALRRKLAA